MAIRIPIITDLQDQGIKNAKIAFGNFKTAVKDAEGGLNKFKAGSTAALDAVKANAGVFAIAGAAAFIKFASAGINAFQDLALASGKFADATGLSVEQASRFIEVAGDIGIESKTVEAAFGKMNKTLGNSPKLFSDLGVEVVKTKNGTTDANATFLNVVERLKGIKDPAEKAKVATQLLGKGWQSMAELINMGSTQLKASLQGVSDAKVINQAELQRAREYRAAQDNLRDAFEDISITVGEELVPALTSAITQLSKIANTKIGGQSIFGTLITGAKYAALAMIEGPAAALKSIHNESVLTTPGIESVSRALREQAQAAEAAESRALAIAEAFKRLKMPIENVYDAWKRLTGALSTQVEIDNAIEQIDALSKAAAKAFGSGSQADLFAYHKALSDVTNTIAALAGDMDIASSKQIKILVDTGDLQGAVALIAKIKAFQTTYGNVSDPYAAMAGANRMTLPPGLDFSGFRASGGPVMGGQSYLVGERGPELFTPGTSGSITPNGAMGGNTITVNVNGGDPDAIVRAIQKYARQSGAIPLQTTTSARF
jgi:hypothetical protein